MRSKDIYGPYEVKTVMAQGNTTINGPHQGGWVETQTGESWFVNFQDKKMYGRVIHLNPVKWINDWPVIGVDKDGDGCGEPVSGYKKPNVGAEYPIETPVESDEFNTRTLGLQWQWHANYQDYFGFPSQMGFMRIYGHTLSDSFINFWEVPNLLLQKFPSEEFTVTTKLKISALEEGEKAGLIVMGWDYCYLALEKKGDQFVLEQTLCKDAEQMNPEQTIILESFPAKPENSIGPSIFSRTIFMRLTVNQGGRCIFAFSNDGKTFTPIGQPFQARQGKWIGAKAGLFATNPSGTSKRGWVDVDWFRITK
jgi:beta-xylosidase